MTFKLTRFLGAAALVAGLTFAQAPQPAPGTGQQARPMKPGRGKMMGRMAQRLGLTDEQKAQAREIFKSAAEAGKPARTAMRDARKALNDAAKNNAPDAQIERLSQDVGQHAAQLAANQAKAFAKFYSILTPEQRQKLDAAGERFRNGDFRPARFNGRRGGPAGFRQ